jgi:hypothetical protein
MEALNNTVNHVKNELMPGVDFAQFDRPREEQHHDEVSTAQSTADTELKWD